MREARAMVKALRSTQAPAPDGLAPSVMAEVGLLDTWTQIEGPIGPLFVAWGRSGITAAERAGDPAGFETEYELRHGRPLRRVAAMPRAMLAQIHRRFAGERTDGPALDLGTLTDFEQAVLRKTLEIPYGEVRPYSWVAREIGRPRAVRAVGSALAGNPITFVIPCHRVVRADGHIGNYGAGGPEAKREVLELEGVDTEQLERTASRGVRYTGSDSTSIYCYPSCRHARCTSAQHEVRFHSAQEARAAGYRPCKVCRPLEGTPFAA
ncbi:MAG: methylated-DNA--[protein]-cysteine S-methyltransferase [Chloroflexota bacterium]